MLREPQVTITIRGDEATRAREEAIRAYTMKPRDVATKTFVASLPLWAQQHQDLDRVLAEIVVDRGGLDGLASAMVCGDLRTRVVDLTPKDVQMATITSLSVDDEYVALVVRLKDGTEHPIRGMPRSLVWKWKLRVGGRCVYGTFDNLSFIRPASDFRRYPPSTRA